METDTDVCSSFLNKLQNLYTIEGLDEFLAYTPSETGPTIKEFELSTRDKHSNELIGDTAITINRDEKSISILNLERYKRGNVRNEYTKGLGKAMMYVVVCRALALNYKIQFGVMDTNLTRLIEYYEESGFERPNKKGRRFDTTPTQEVFYPRIQEFLKTLKNTSPLLSLSYKPDWIKHPTTGKLVFQCPICKKMSTSYLTLKAKDHDPSCENRNKYPDVSEKPQQIKGGLRKTQKNNKKRLGRYRKRLKQLNEGRIVKTRKRC